MCPPDIGPTRIRRTTGAISDTQAGSEVLNFGAAVAGTTPRVFVQRVFAKKPAGEGYRAWPIDEPDIIVK
jgi:hypothetical protein